MKTAIIRWHVAAMILIFLPSCAPSALQTPTMTATIAPTHTKAPTSTETPVPSPTLTPSPTSPISGVVEVYEVYNVVTGWGWPTGAAITLALFSEAGELKEELSLFATGTGDLPWTELTTDIDVGDIISVKVGADQVQFSVRLHEVVVDLEENTIHGSVGPFEKVLTQVERPDNFFENEDATADDEGKFTVGYPDYVDLELRDRIWVGGIVHANAIMKVTEYSKQVRYEPAPSTEFFVDESSRITPILEKDGFAAAGDFDRDGDVDLVFTSSAKYPVLESPGPTYILDNDGTGNFTDVTHDRLFGQEILAYARGIAVDDLTGDGWLDIVIATEDLHAPPYTKYRDIILVNQGDGRFLDETQDRFPDYPVYSHGLCLGDIENDGDTDIFFNMQTRPTGLMVNDGEGYFSNGSGRLPPIRYDEISCSFADFDHDGDLDLFFGTERAETRNRLLLNDGSGRFKLAPAAAVPNKPTGYYDLALATAVGDFNDDGYPDVVTANANYWDPETNEFIHLTQARLNQLLLSNGDGTFRDATENLPQSFDGGATIEIAVSDVDKDGDLDIIPANHWATAGIVYLNDGQGEFEEALNSVLPTPLDDGQHQVLVFDFDGDGDDDVLLVAHFRHWLYKNLHHP